MTGLASNAFLWAGLAGFALGVRVLFVWLDARRSTARRRAAYRRSQLELVARAGDKRRG